MFEMTTSSAISLRRRGEKEMINAMQFRLADATETVSTGRMIFGILDTNYWPRSDHRFSGSVGIYRISYGAPCTPWTPPIIPEEAK